MQNEYERCKRVRGVNKGVRVWRVRGVRGASVNVRRCERGVRSVGGVRVKVLCSLVQKVSGRERAKRCAREQQREACSNKGQRGVRREERSTG